MKWMSNWRDYPDAEPWTLVNVAEAYRAAGDDEQSAVVSEFAIEQPPGNGLCLHHLWMAVDCVQRGDYEQATSRLAMQDEEYDEDYSFLLRLVEINVEFGMLEPQQRQQAFPAIRTEINKLVKNYSNLKTEPARKRFMLWTVDRIAVEVGGFRATLWSKLKHWLS